MAEKAFTRTSRKNFWKEIKRNKVAYAYIAPFYILFAVFGLFPITAGMVMSFISWDGAGPMNFVGLKNYIDLINTKLFWKSLSNTAIIGIVGNFFNLFGGIVLAYILNSKLIKFRNLFKTIYFLPMITSAVAASIVFSSLFSLNSGVINFILKSLGFDKINWFGGTGQYIKVAIIIMFSWKWIGWNMVIYLAGMQGISQDMYEAAMIDGASHISTFTRITLPLLKPIVLFTIIQSTIGSINLFTEPYMLLGGTSMTGGTANQGLTVMMFLLNKAPYGNNLYGFASACAYILCAIIIVISVFCTNILGNRDDTGKKD